MARKYRWFSVAVLVGVTALLAHCNQAPPLEIGGGMAYQYPPTTVKAGKSAVWEFQMAVWGEGPPVQAQVRSVRMEYRLGENSQWTEALPVLGSPTNVKVGQSIRMQFRFSVAAPADSEGSAIQTRFHVRMGERIQVIDGIRAVDVISAKSTN